MRIVSWNVNGILSKVEHRDFDAVLERSPDVICVQEIRTKSEPEVAKGYRHIWNHAERDGFWGTLALAREEPRRVLRETGIPEIDREGRLLALDYPDFWLVDVYVPNAKGGLRRKAVRREWDKALCRLAGELAYEKPTIVCGDFNTTISDEDIYEGSPWRGHDEEEGFPTDERAGLAELVEGGFVDAFRLVHPDAEDAYTWWSQRRDRRAVNHGWRLDYFLVSEDAAGAIRGCEHLTGIRGSDHCPIELEVAL